MTSDASLDVFNVRQERAGPGAGPQPLPLEAGAGGGGGSGRPPQPALRDGPEQERAGEGRDHAGGGQQDHPRQEEEPAQPRPAAAQAEDPAWRAGRHSGEGE